MVTQGRKLRQEKVEKLKKKVDESKSLVFAKYHGLSAVQISELRLRLADKGAEAKVARNTLMKIAIGDENLELQDGVMTVFSYDDPIAGIKVLVDFAKEVEKPEVISGYVDGKFVNAAELKVLSELPSREELLAKVVGGLKSPLNGLVGTLGGIQRNFVSVLSQVAKTKEN